MVRKKRKKNKSAIIIAVLSALVIAGFLFIFTNPSFWFKKSIHDDAKSYSTRSCLVFYPDNSDGKKLAKSMCKGVKDNRVYDYSLVPYGDYYFVSYGNGNGYFVDKEYKTIKIENVTDFGKRIIADYLRYTVKKDDPDTYYNADFIKETSLENLNFDDITYDIQNEYLKCRFKEYDYDILVPLKYMQQEIGMNFNYPNEVYAKPTYIDSNHPVICLTFDDGPNFTETPEESSSTIIVDTLYEYDATATFYVVGYELEKTEEEWTDYQIYTFLKESIANGNEYGSHTSGHEDLINDVTTAESIVKVIKGPEESIKDAGIDYEMVTYRPPGGVFDENTLAAQPYPAILWNIDSEDWISMDPDAIYEKVLSYDIDDGDVILFHEIYDETAEAIKKLVPELINRGYQLVTVKDMLKHFNIDVNTLSFYYNFKPSPYYE